MTAALMMTLAFLLLTGGALLYCNILKMNIGEGMILSASTLIVLIFLSGHLLDQVKPGRNAFLLLAAAGFVVTIVQLKRKRFDLELVKSLYWPALASMVLLGFLLFAGDYIQHIDELHMWAAAPKYMLDYNKLPLYDDFIGDTVHNIGTSAFHYFFQSITGFNEWMMYESNFLLYWIGFLLPLSNLKRKYWKEALLYIAVLYFAFFTFYLYGSKNLYVDLAVSGWAGGLTAWALKRKRRKENLLLYVAVFYMIYSFKGWAGMVLSGFLAVYLLLTRLVLEREENREKWMSYTITGLTLSLGVFSLGVLFVFRFLKTHDLRYMVPAKYVDKVSEHGYSLDKVNKTVTDFLIRCTGRGLCETKSFLTINYVEGIILCILIIVICGYVYNRKKESRIYSLFLLNCGLIYASVVLVGYIFKISYHEAIRTSGGSRYLAIYVMFIFAFALAMLLFSDSPNPGGKKIPWTASLILLSLFSYGLTTQYVANNTSWAPRNVYKYQPIMEQKGQANCILEMIGEGEKVYFLNQKADKLDDLGNNPALFYLGGRMSNTRYMPWKFTASGCVIRLDDSTKYKLTDFPQILADGGFSYVWIYKTDEYLNSYLPQVMNMPVTGFAASQKALKGEKVDANPSGIIDGQLYKVIYDQAGKASLQLMRNLESFDKRESHISE